MKKETYADKNNLIQTPLPTPKSLNFLKEKFKETLTQSEAISWAVSYLPDSWINAIFYS